jgi:hypothetical protein
VSKRIMKIALYGILTAILAPSSRADGTILLDTIDGSNTSNTNRAWNLGGTSTNGQIIGDDPGNTAGVPTTAATSGYAVAPFLLDQLPDGSTSVAISHVQIVINLQAPTGTGLTGDVYGAFFTPGANANGPSLSAATQVSQFFSFNASASENNGIGTNTVERLTASPTSMPMLNANQVYWLVIAPQAGLNAQPGASLTDYGVLLQNSNSFLAKEGISPTTAYGSFGTTINGQSYGQLYEQEGAQPGDTLTPDTSYFGVEIVAASVPETSTLVSALLGLIPIGLLVRRRLS